jgi:hypothetical protein
LLRSILLASTKRAREFERMVDSFALGLTHGLLLLAACRLLLRPDLDDPAAPQPDVAARPDRGFRPKRRPD